ncbi:MAG: alpha-1,2-fucosyltransferase [Desulfuromonadales bacterium]|nr:MAG: alpha-1,2-fucosyltransferase [Desulfuromonadales bacterium]
MVIVRLNGGIGNQMFQYAAARRIAHVNSAPLKLDLSWFQEKGPWTPRHFELRVFALSCEIAHSSEVRTLKSRRQNAVFRKLPGFIKSRLFHTNQTHIIEKSYAFDPAILSLKGDVFLDGYWQSDKYFRDIETVLRADFAFREDMDDDNAKSANLIQASESVSIHIRRGDYVSLPAAQAFHGLCPIAYYQDAVHRIRSQVANPTFFVFSDDMVWVKEHLKLGERVHYVDHNGPNRGHDDMRLMSLCKHHVIANSSFSWWGAWLSVNPDKIVYAPQRWFNKDVKSRDNIPESWLCI